MNKRKVLLLAFAFIGFTMTVFGQAPTKLDTLYIKGSITKEEYDLLKKLEKSEQQTSKYDSLYRAGKITESEYKILMGTKKEVSVTAPNKTRDKKVRYVFTAEMGTVVSLALNMSDEKYHQYYYQGWGKPTNYAGKDIMVAIDVVNGILLNNTIQLGLGVGFQGAVRSGYGSRIPFYFDFRYQPLKGKVSPVIVQQFGGTAWLRGFVNATSRVGMFYGGYAGVSIKSSKRISGHVLLGYQMNHIDRGWYSIYDVSGGVTGNYRSHVFFSNVSLRGGIRF